MLYLCEGDGADRRFRILSPRCSPDHPSPQQRDTRHFLQEVEALLERFIPSVERMQTQLDQYKVAFTDTTVENASLKKEVAELQSKLDTAKRGSVQKKLDDAQLLSDYRELRRIVERIPPEILERAKRQESSAVASRCTR